nr:SRPBCC family protein [uncultured Sphingomonas sp.]
MASIHHDIFIAAAPDAIWRAVRAVDRLHDLLVPGFVTATEMLDGEGAPVRRVTFANGHVVDEAIVSIDDERRRLVWTVKQFEHHNGVLTVMEAEAEGGARVSWTADLLPDALAETVSPMMAQGLAIMKVHLEGAAA